MTPELARFIALVEDRLGLRLGGHREGHALGVLERRALATRRSTADYLGTLPTDRAEWRELASELTVGETFFFRHGEQLAAFTDIAIPASVARGRLNVLSAACSSGEEPYTLAMLIAEHTELRGQLVGADLNPTALARARRGRYSRWSLRTTSPEHEARWFVREGSEVAVVRALRDRVSFEEHNLIVDDELWAAGRWDVVFCRNAIMYLAPEHQERVIARIATALVPGGYLFLGHAETLRDRARFELCHTHGTFYFRASGRPAIAARPPASTAWIGEIAAASTRVDSLAARLAVPTEPSAPLVRILALLDAECFTEARLALAELPVDRDVLVLRALIATHAGELAVAEVACEAALALDPGCAQAHYLIAQCRQSTEEPELATYHARRASELDPSFAMAHVLLGLLARRAGDRPGARRELAASLDLLEREEPRRLARFGGGLGKLALVGLCRAELAHLEAQ